MAAPNDELLARFARRERAALARLISLVEAGTAPPLPSAEESQPPRPPLGVIGITGSGGAGKSTLIAALVRHLRQNNVRVAVLACDPQSPRSGGAFLGDRIRMQIDAADDGLYFRSLSTRGAQGGISAAIGPAVPWLAAFGFQAVLVETVGAGQDQTAVRDVADKLVLVVTPGSGDEIQWDKAGVLEVADIVAINKSDQPGAEDLRRQLEIALALSPQTAATRVLHVTARTGEGIEELWSGLSRLSARK